MKVRRKPLIEYDRCRMPVRKSLIEYDRYRIPEKKSLIKYDRCQISVRKPWTEEEDEILREVYREALSKGRKPTAADLREALPHRNQKQCRERYENHLNPCYDHSRHSLTLEQIGKIIRLQKLIGNRWSEIGKRLNLPPGRVKNEWHSRITHRTGEVILEYSDLASDGRIKKPKGKSRCIVDVFPLSFEVLCQAVNEALESQ